MIVKHTHTHTRVSVIPKEVYSNTVNVFVYWNEERKATSTENKGKERIYETDPIYKNFYVSICFIRIRIYTYSITKKIYFSFLYH